MEYKISEKAYEGECVSLLKSVVTKPRPKSSSEKYYIIECQLCFQCFPLKSLFIHHFYLNHSEQSELLLKFVCLKCNKKFSSYPSIYQHKAVHTVEKSHQCSECNYKTARKRDLKLHIYHRHCAGLIKCNVCDKVFKGNKQLEKHRTVHQLKNLFKCNICNKLFSSFHFLKKHKSEHSRALVCSICRMPCTCFNFKNHMGKHNKEMTSNLNKRKRSCYSEFYTECCSRDSTLTETWNEKCKLSKMKLVNYPECSPHQHLNTEYVMPYQSLLDSFECYGCGIIFSSYSALEDHSNEHETKTKPKWYPEE